MDFIALTTGNGQEQPSGCFPNTCVERPNCALIRTSAERLHTDLLFLYFNGRKAAASHQRISLLGNGNGLKLGIAVSIRSGSYVSVHSVERDPQVAIVNATSVYRQFRSILRDVAQEFPTC